MLQQTQVKTVIPYWERWMRELPTIKALGKARAARIHKLWEGLGYYTRVRNLQKAAQQIVAQHDGQFPERFDDMLALPGVGRYTAGAVSSIAFNQPRPILDGNVIRVLTRVFGIATDPREKRTSARLWQLAEELVLYASRITSCSTSRRAEAAKTAGYCSALNQSLMELGALICTPRSPQCGVCPIRKQCIAQKNGLQDKLPNLGRREAATPRRFMAFIVERNGKFLVRQRAPGGLNAHLWEFPNIEIPGAGQGGVRHSVRATPQNLGNGVPRSDSPWQAKDFRPTSARPLCIIKHSITRYRITLEAWRAELAKPSHDPDRWCKPSQLRMFAFTAAHKRILAALASGRTKDSPRLIQ